MGQTLTTILKSASLAGGKLTVSQDDLTDDTSSVSVASPLMPPPSSSRRQNHQMMQPQSHHRQAIQQPAASDTAVSLAGVSRSLRGRSQRRSPERPPNHSSSNHQRDHQVVLPRRDSDPLITGMEQHQGQPKRSGSVPIKKPQTARHHYHTTHSSTAQDDSEESSDHLMKMYDSRTWMMYRRITDSRRERPVTYDQSHLDRSLSNQNEWNLPDEHSNHSGHEMIFVFDLD